MHWRDLNLNNKIEFLPQNIDSDSLSKIVEKYGDRIEAIYPLSPGQAWMLEKTKKVTDAFFLQNVFRVELAVRPEFADKWVKQVIRKRPSLRTAFAWRGMKTPYQVVLKERDAETKWIDRSDKGLEELSDEIEAFCAADRARGFDLEQDTLVRAAIFEAKKNAYAIIISRPHLIDDGESDALLAKDLFFDGLMKGKLRLAHFKKASYQEYAKWLEGRDREKDLLYWKELLKNGSMTALPWRRSSEKEMDLKTLVHSFSKEETKKLQSLPGRYKATLNSILHAIWALLLAGHTGKKDLVFGTLASGRSTEVAGIDQLTGCFINAFPVRVEVKEEEPFGELARRIQAQILSSREHAYLPPTELERELGKEEGFFDHLLNFHNFQGAAVADVIRKKLPGYTYLGVETYDNLSTGFCLYFDIIEGQLSLRFCYDANQFSEEWIRKLERAFLRMIRQLLADKDQSLACGRIQVLETISDQLAAREVSEHTALICGEESVSYRQLAADAKRIARCLLAQGLRKGDRVLLTLENSINFVRAMYGVLLAGGVYVAADAKWPAERLRLISEEAGISARITDEKISEYISTECQEIPLPAVREEDEAAIYYTSGSTGTPKGTVLHHRLLLGHANPSEILQEYYERDRFLTFPIFTSVTPLFLVLMYTAYEKTLVILTPQEMNSIDRLVDCIIRNQVQSVIGTPSFLLHALEHPAFAKVVRQQVTHLGIGGEFLKASDSMKLCSAMENGVLTNGYGTSETYICSISRAEPGKELRLERFPRGVKLYVVDNDLNPVSNGEDGEVLVGGACSRYWHYLDPELNRKKYVDHPLYGHCFRVGDAARLDEDGRIILLGRIDHMIKLHGLRIEPGEVEAAMEQYSGILRAAVALKEEQLCGYYTAESEIDETRLRMFLSERLPYYMIPSILIRMETFPMSGNGKLDYKALPVPEKGARQGSAPENDQERLLCRIFGESLETNEPVGADDSFFSLGGDSLRAFMVMGELEKEGLSLEIKDFFTAPTPRLLAPRLKVHTEDIEPKEMPLEVPEEIRAAIEGVIDWNEVETVYPASAVAETYLKNNSSTWQQVYCFEIKGDTSSEQVEAALEKVSRNHTALRSLILPAGNGHFCQAVLKTPRNQFFRTDLSALSEGEMLSGKQKNYLSTLIRMEYSSMTELGKKTLLRVGHIRTSKDRALLYIGSSHLTIEGASVYQIFRELTGQEPSEPDAHLMNRHMARLLSGDRSEAEAYWETLLNGCDAYTVLPAETAPKEEGKKEFVYSSCGQVLYEKARNFCRTHQITFSALLGFSLGKSLMKILSLEEVCFPVAGNGRSTSEMKLPGMFVVFFPLRITKEDTVFTCQRQLLSSGEHAWVWADPEYSPLGGSTLYLRSTHSSSSAEEEQMRLFMDVLGPKQMREVLDGYFAFGTDEIGIYAETMNQLSWSFMFDSGMYDPDLIRSLSAEWIRQIKICIGEGKTEK